MKRMQVSATKSRTKIALIKESVFFDMKVENEVALDSMQHAGAVSMCVILREQRRKHVSFYLVSIISHDFTSILM